MLYMNYGISVCAGFWFVILKEQRYVLTSYLNSHSGGISLCVESLVSNKRLTHAAALVYSV